MTNNTSAQDQEAIDFAEWLAENTEIIREPKITLYRYHDVNGWGNYILEDIYTVFKEKYEPDQPTSAQQEDCTACHGSGKCPLCEGSGKQTLIYAHYGGLSPRGAADQEIDRLRRELSNEMETTKSLTSQLSNKDKQIAELTEANNYHAQLASNRFSECVELQEQIATLTAQLQGAAEKAINYMREHVCPSTDDEDGYYYDRDWDKAKATYLNNNYPSKEEEK